ncbi:MAG: hypothetical protein FWE31_02640 [Firmicutes bacterium]|nr:hypothetical protein [Bacillota bacterium]
MKGGLKLSKLNTKGRDRLFGCEEQFLEEFIQALGDYAELANTSDNFPEWHKHFDIKGVNSAEIHKQLGLMLPLEGKEGYAVVDMMANLSSSALYVEALKRLNNIKNKYEITKVVAEQDFANLVNLMTGKEAIQTKLSLPADAKMMPRKNKFTNPLTAKISLEALPKSFKHIVAPGYGAIYFGLMAKALGLEYSILNMSHYHKSNGIGQQRPGSQFNYDDLKDAKVDEIIVFDNGIKFGLTLREARDFFQPMGFNPKLGAIGTGLYHFEVEHDKEFEDIDFFGPLHASRESSKQPDSNIHTMLVEGKEKLTEVGDTYPKLSDTTIEYRKRVEDAINELGGDK